MSNFVSRVLVTVVGVPVVLYLVYLGDWWLFGLAAFAALVALHELYVMARSLRPLVLAGYAGAFATLLGAHLGGPEWMVGGFMLTLVLAFLLYGIAETRQPATVTMSTTVMGVAWIALGLGHLVLLRDVPEHGRLAVFTVLLAVFADDTAAYLVGRVLGRHKLAPRSRRGRPGRASSPAPSRRSQSPSSRSTSRISSRSPSRSPSAPRSRLPERPATSSSRRSSAICR